MSGVEEQRGFSRAALQRARYREIARVLWEERLFDAFRGIGLEEHLPPNAVPFGPAAPRGEAKDKEVPGPVRVRRALERLGPVYIKIGQALATRADVVPPAFLGELSKLQDHVQPVPWPAMKASIETELGASVSKLFRGGQTHSDRGCLHRTGVPRNPA